MDCPNCNSPKLISGVAIINLPVVTTGAIAQGLMIASGDFCPDCEAFQVVWKA